jgi:glycerophosphoryl diester phosphodiesterase
MKHLTGILASLLFALASLDAGAQGVSADPGRPHVVDRTVIVSAHRGGAAYAPENTLDAFANAVGLGVDQIETDARLTADGVLVLVHDDTLDRTTDCSGTVSRTNIAQLASCDAAYWFTPGRPTVVDEAAEHPLRGRGITVPAARELFAYIQSLGDQAPEVSIEIKNIPGQSDFDASGRIVAPRLVALIREFGLQGKTIVQSFWPASLGVVKALDPSIRTQFLTDHRYGQTAYINLGFIQAYGHDISAPNFDQPDFTGAFVVAAHALGKQVIPYTVDYAGDIEYVAALGVDGVISNYPGCVLELQGRLNGVRVTPPQIAGYRVEPCPAPS